MSLITEDGNGLSTAESFASVSEANTYHSIRGNTNWATISTAEAEEALRRATDYIEQVYGPSFMGSRVSSTQALSFPRYSIELYGYSVASNVIPVILKNATCALAFKAASGDLSPDITQAVKREKIDVIEVEYMDSSSQIVRFRDIDNILAPLLTNMPSGASRKLVRC